MGVELDVVDAEVEGAEAFLPGGTVGGEASADSAEEASRGGPGGGFVEVLEHGLGGGVGGVARDGAVGEEGIDVLVLARHLLGEIGEESRPAESEVERMAGRDLLILSFSLATVGAGRGRRKQIRGKLVIC